MSVELVQCMSQLVNLVMLMKIFTHVKFAENKVDCERTFLFLLSLYKTQEIKFTALGL